MPKKILLTRPQASSARWADLLARRNFDCVIAPLLTIEPTGAPRPTGDFQAVLLTSANAPDALESLAAQIGDLLTLPCFCVGSGTAAAARAIGFTDVRCGASDSAEMARLVVSSLEDGKKPLLHIAGDVVEGKARHILEAHQFELASWTIYRAIACEDLSPELCAAFARGDFFALPVFSPRSARLLVSLIEKNRLAAHCSGIAAIGFSQAVADVLQILPWRRLHVAKAPSEQEMLACLQSECAMTETETPPLPPPMPKPTRKKNAALPLLCFLLLGAALAFIAVSYARRDPQMAATVAAIAPPEIVPVQHEGAAPESANADIVALNEEIAALEKEVEQVKAAQAQNSAAPNIAAFAAFEDLRRAAEKTGDFSAPLAALRAAAPNDAVIAAQTAALQAYAAGVLSLPVLRAELSAAAQKLNAPQAPDENPTLWSRVKQALRPLISVHPLHDPQLAAIETALDQGRAEAALDAFNNLPTPTQEALGTWKQKLSARAAVDAALQILDTHFIQPGAAP